MSFMQKVAAWRERRAAREVEGDRMSQGRRDVALIAATGGAALLFAPFRTEAAQVPPPPPSGAAGRAAIGMPVNGISAIDAAYGCVDDGQEGMFNVTYTANTALLKCVTQAAGVVNVANNGPNSVATVTFGSTAGSVFDGRQATTAWINKTIAITCPDTTIFVSRVVSLSNDVSTSAVRLTLADAAPAGLATGSNITTQYACPCFQVAGNLNYYVGKTIMLVTGGQTGGASNGALSGNPEYYVPMVKTISSITDAYNIVLSGNITAPNSVSSQPPMMLVRFGTNNSGDSTTGAIKACVDAYKTPGKAVFYTGLTKAVSTGIFYMFDMFPNSGSTWSAANLVASNAYSLVKHFTSDAEALFMSECVANAIVHQDLQLPVRGIPYTAEMKPPPPYKGVYGAASLPRCAAQKSVIKACVIGDSWAVITVFGQATNTPAMELMRAFEAQNPGKTVIWDWRGVGGSKYFDIISGVNFPGVAANVPWSTGTHPYIYYATNHSAGGSPDVIFCHSGGVNDGGGNIHANDVVGAYNSLRAITPTYNGLPPDVVLVSYGARFGQLVNAGSIENSGWDDEYGATYVANICKSNSIPLIELGPSMAYAGPGWSRYNTRMRLRPNVPQAVVTSLIPYHIPYKCYNFMMAVKLVGTGGADFWGRATTLEFVVSSKDDCRVVVGLDAAGTNLTVRTQSWGKFVDTTLTLANGSKSLVTSGQANQNINHGVFPSPPSFSLAISAGSFSGLQNKSLLFNGVGLTGSGGQRDFRTFCVGANAGSIAWATDGNGQTNVCTSMWGGGHMFIPGDALANADVIISSGGTVLQTKCATGGYTDFQTMALQDAWTGGGIVAASTSMFLGRITYGPSYQQAVAGGTDATGNGYIVLEVIDNRCWIGYVAGTNAGGANPMVNIAGGIKNVWAGKIERPGTMFYPRIYISNPTPASAVNIQAVQVSIGEELLFRPPMAVGEMFPVLTPDTAYPFGGDGAHPSQEVVQRVFRDVLAAQDFNTNTIDSASSGQRSVTVAANSTAATALVLPADASIARILIENTTANAVTGGLDIGTTAGGADIVSAVAVGANARVTSILGGTLLLDWFSVSAAQSIFFTAHTGWNSASLNIRVMYYR